MNHRQAKKIPAKIHRDWRLICREFNYKFWGCTAPHGFRDKQKRKWNKDYFFRVKAKIRKEREEC